MGGCLKALLCTAIGGVIGWFAGADHPDTGAIIGCGIGLVIGFFFGTEEWR